MAGLNEGSNQGGAEEMMKELERQAANHFETVDDMAVNTVRASVGDAVTKTIQDDWKHPGAPFPNSISSVAEEEAYRSAVLAPANNSDMSGANDVELDSRLVA